MGVLRPALLSISFSELSVRYVVHCEQSLDQVDGLESSVCLVVRGDELFEFRR